MPRLSRRSPNHNTRNNLLVTGCKRTNWWLETANSATNFANVNNNGNANNNNASNTNIRAPL